MEKIPATVVKVVPSKIEEYGFNGKRYETGNLVIVQEIESGRLHTLLNRSLNQVPIELRQVGVRGFIEWCKSASYNLPFFSA